MIGPERNISWACGLPHHKPLCRTDMPAAQKSNKVGSDVWMAVKQIAPIASSGSKNPMRKIMIPAAAQTGLRGVLPEFRRHEGMRPTALENDLALIGFRVDAPLSQKWSKTLSLNPGLIEPEVPITAKSDKSHFDM